MKFTSENYSKVEVEFTDCSDVESEHYYAASDDNAIEESNDDTSNFEVKHQIKIKKINIPPIVQLKKDNTDYKPPMILSSCESVNKNVAYKSTLPCKYGKKCHRVNCTFAHNPSELKIICCRQHHKGSDYEKCLYYHLKLENEIQYKDRIFNYPEDNTSNVVKTKICRYGLKCNRLDCKFAHTSGEKKTFPCRDGDNCKYKNCRFFHPKESQEQVRIRLRDYRKTALLQAIENNNLTYREDSYLYTGFISGELNSEWNLDKIIRRMCEMKWLFEYTNFKEFYILEKKNMTFDGAEAQVIKQYPYPKSWPWNKK